jgi:hypothetical protein
MNEKNWVPFYFEGNQAWGWIKDAEEWERIKKAYDNDIKLLRTARRNPNNEKDAFGFYNEYNGSDNLGDHEKKYDMDLN